MGVFRHRATVALSLALALMFLAPTAAIAGPGTPSSPGTPSTEDAPSGETIDALSLDGFLENGGQIDDSVRYYARSPAGGIALTDTGAVLSIVGPGVTGCAHGCNVVLTFEGGAGTAPVGRGPLPGTTNFLRGQDPTRWHTGLRTYGQVVYEGLWSGVDLVYLAEGGTLKYELVLGPGADASEEMRARLLREAQSAGQLSAVSSSRSTSATW